MSLDTIFAQAIEMDSAQERAVFLDEACGSDPALRREVEALVRNHFRAGEFLEPVTVHEPVHEGPGTVIGPYKMLEQIGEGGFGVVFMAEQQQPIRRKVALKVIKPGMDTRQVIARFEAERQALAVMDHPNIAKVLDAGATASGRPYFVMELVKGLHITKFCDRARMALRERLELFVRVCQAVQHAHQKGIIHRDLKPSNVLVSLEDGQPWVKVIDFGIAKAIAGRLTDKSLFTGFGQMIGTPLYMSPEQAGQGPDIDTRSDIYSLGVVLYELLTGSTPFGKERFKQATYEEICRIIREEEPSKPSTRLSESHDSLATLSAERHTEPAKLTKLVRGELDWIVMKCLEKDRNRRYETASALAADVQRYLADEPVLAGPPSVTYRLRKFVKRHRGPVLAATMVFLTLVAGIVGTTLGLVEAEQAHNDEAKQRVAAETNAERAQDEEGKAKAARGEAEELARQEKAARDRAEKQLLRAEWLLYASRINLAQDAWENNNARLAFHHLESCRRDFRGWEHDYLFTLFHSIPHATLRAHTASVSSVALGPDGKRIVSGSRDGTVRVWDVATGKNPLTLEGRTGMISSVAMSLDGKRIVSGNSDPMGEALTVWDAATGQEIRTLKGQATWISGVVLSPDGNRIVTASGDGTVKIWDVATGQNTLNLMGHTDAIFSVALSPDGKRIVSGSRDKTVKLWDAATGKEILTLQDTAEVFSVVLSPNGKRIVSGSRDGTVKIWDVTTGQNTLTIKGHTDLVSSVAMSRDGKRLVSGSFDMTVKVWDAATGQEIRTLKGHTHYVNGVALSPDADRIVSASADGTVKVWDATVTQETPTVKPPVGDVFATAALSPDNKRIVSATRDGTVNVWDPATGQKTLSLKGHTNLITSLAFSPDGRRIISNDDKTVRVWDSATGQEALTLEGHTSFVPSVALSRDQRRIVSVSVDGTVRIWDEAGGVETRTLKGYSKRQGNVYVQYLALSADARHVVAGRNDGSVQVWDVATGDNTLNLKGHTQIVYSVAMSLDGKRIVSGSSDQTVKVWDTATGDELLTLKGHNGAVTHVALMPDAKRIVSGSSDQSVKVWDAATGFETLTLKGTFLAVSPDGKRILSTSADGTLQVWDASRSAENR